MLLCGGLDSRMAHVSGVVWQGVEKERSR
jgi:hypothetical protein